MSNTITALAAIRELLLAAAAYQNVVGKAQAEGRDVTPEELAQLRANDDAVRAAGQAERERAISEDR